MEKSHLDLLKLIEHSFFYHAGYQLPVPAGVDDRYLWLHTQAPYGLLAHDGSDYPRFIYANHQAMQCFKYTREEIIGLPSRCSASESDRPARQTLLSYVKKNGFAEGYTGPRVDKYNQTFTIYEGTIWQLQHSGHELFGQAALFWPDDFNRPEWFNDHQNTKEIPD